MQVSNYTDIEKNKGKVLYEKHLKRLNELIEMMVDNEVYRDSDDEQLAYV